MYVGRDSSHSVCVGVCGVVVWVCRGCGGGVVCVVVFCGRL